jgi:hypothetical protein
VVEAVVSSVMAAQVRACLCYSSNPFPLLDQAGSARSGGGVYSVSVADQSSPGSAQPKYYPGGGGGGFWANGGNAAGAVGGAGGNADGVHGEPGPLNDYGGTGPGGAGVLLGIGGAGGGLDSNGRAGAGGGGGASTSILVCPFGALHEPRPAINLCLRAIPRTACWRGCWPRR